MRRTTFLTTAAATGMAALTAPVVAAGLTTVRVGGTPDSDVVAAIWGVHSGIFPKLGLDVQVVRLNSGSAVSAAVVGGAIDVGKSSVFALIAGHVRGVPFQIESEGALYETDKPTVGFVVAKDSPISTGRDFTGKVVASPALGDLFSTVAAAWIDQNGGDSKTTKFVEFPTNATADAIAGGRVDGAVMTDPILADALASGKCRSIGHPFDVIAKKFGVTYYFCMPDYIAKNTDVLARFRRGLAQSTTYALAHPTEVAPLVAQYTGVSLEVALKGAQPIGIGIDPAMLQPTIDFAARAKIIGAPFPARDLIDPAALHP